MNLELQEKLGDLFDELARTSNHVSKLLDYEDGAEAYKSLINAGSILWEISNQVDVEINNYGEELEAKIKKAWELK